MERGSDAPISLSLMFIQCAAVWDNMDKQFMVHNLH